MDCMSIIQIELIFFIGDAMIGVYFFPYGYPILPASFVENSSKSV